MAEKRIIVGVLAEFPYVVVRLGCDLCKRHGRYSLARLAEKYGAGITLEDLLRQMTVDCPQRHNSDRRSPRKYAATCHALFTDLYRLPPPPPDMPPAMMGLRLIEGGKSDRPNPDVPLFDEPPPPKRKSM